jgi:hypothetical protein
MTHLVAKTKKFSEILKEKCITSPGSTEKKV